MRPIYPIVAATLLGAVIAGSNDGTNRPLVEVQTAAAADQIRPITLEEMIADSEKIFAGACTKIEEIKKDPKAGVNVVEYTFNVTKGIKGVMGCETKFKQYTGIVKNLVPRYEKGQTYILFLSPPSPNSGLTAPVGLQQGCLHVYKKDGKELVLHEGKEIESGQFINTVKDILDKLNKQKKK